MALALVVFGAIECPSSSGNTAVAVLQLSRSEKLLFASTANFIEYVEPHSRYLVASKTKKLRLVR